MYLSLFDISLQNKQVKYTVEDNSTHIPPVFFSRSKHQTYVYNETTAWSLLAVSILHIPKPKHISWCLVTDISNTLSTCMVVQITLVLPISLYLPLSYTYFPILTCQNFLVLSFNLRYFLFPFLFSLTLDRYPVLKILQYPLHVNSCLASKSDLFVHSRVSFNLCIYKYLLQCTVVHNNN